MIAIRQLEAELHKFKLSVMKITSRERKSSEGLQGKVKKRYLPSVNRIRK